MPKACNSPIQTKTEYNKFVAQEDGTLYWNGEEVELYAPGSLFAAAASLRPLPELHIHTDRLTHYENAVKVMSLAGKSGMTRLGIVTDPNEEH